MSNYDNYGTPSKPNNNNCRTCTDFQYFSKQQRQIFHKATPDKANTPNQDNGRPTREDCPMDKSSLGRATWGLLHTLAAYYPDKPTEMQKRDVKTFFEVLSRIYPCEYCAEDYRKDLRQHPINVNSQHELSQWLCKFHNRVNEKLGKPLFDCSKVNERWRDGWLDGSCN